MSVRRFQIDVSDAVLEDLRDRLTRSRFTTASSEVYWAGGTDPGYLRELVAYWAADFDWRAAEARLNAFPQFLAEVDGRDVHFVHVRSKSSDDALPLVLTHGWPSSFVEMLPLVGPLTDPGAHGLDPSVSFDVIVPSLPGFAWSETMSGHFTRAGVAEVWHKLMTVVLGYERYGVFGGDIGSGVSARAAMAHPESVVGWHTIHPAYPPSFDPPLNAEEQAFVDAEAAYDVTDQGYSEIMWTRPDTIAAALIDSPAGLAAWIVDKYRDWTDDFAGTWDRDTLLTMLTVYWASGSIGTSFRQYFDFDHNKPGKVITVPTAVTLSHEPVLAGFPRSLAERATADLRHWTEPKRGGHFLPIEQPALMTRELRTFFGPLSTA
jgi:pimeloyl-ACP methyl ester carboxylesterase